MGKVTWVSIPTRGGDGAEALLTERGFKLAQVGGGTAEYIREGDTNQIDRISLQVDLADLFISVNVEDEES